VQLAIQVAAVEAEKFLLLSPFACSCMLLSSWLRNHFSMVAIVNPSTVADTICALLTTTDEVAAALAIKERAWAEAKAQHLDDDGTLLAAVLLQTSPPEGAVTNYLCRPWPIAALQADDPA